MVESDMIYLNPNPILFYSIKERFSFFLKWACEWVIVTQSCPTPCDPMDHICQAPPFMEFSRQEYWSGLPFPSSVSFREQVFIMGNFQNCYFSSCYKQKRIFLKSLSWQPGGFPGGKNTWMCRVLVKIGSPGVSYHQVCPLNIQQFSNITI